MCLQLWRCAEPRMSCCPCYAGHSVQNKLQEVIFRQYFTDGVFPDKDGLMAAAEEVGLDSAAAWEYVEDLENQKSVAVEAQKYSEAGVSGVPFFIINGQPLFSGAQPPESFLAALKLAGESQVSDV